MNAMLKPIDLVNIQDGQPMTSTVKIAAGLGLMHASVIKILHKHLSDVQQFGVVQFKSSYDASELSDSTFKSQHANQGKYIGYCDLNEQQATFLMSLMRNSDGLIQFKKALVDAFFSARVLLQADYFTLVQKHSMLDAMLGFEKNIASQCAKGLNAWKKQRDCLQVQLLDLERQLQPCLELNFKD